MTGLPVSLPWNIVAWEDSGTPWTLLGTWKNPWRLTVCWRREATSTWDSRWDMIRSTGICIGFMDESGWLSWLLVGFFTSKRVKDNAPITKNLKITFWNGRKTPKIQKWELETTKFQISGFDLIDMFHRDAKMPIKPENFAKDLSGAHKQFVVVLRKRWA